MKKNKTKFTISIRVFSIFLATYLVLMTGFSIFLISKEKKTAGMELGAYALQVNNRVEGILQEYLDNDKQITDISKLKAELLKETSFFTLMGTEVAIFTGDYSLLFNTNGYWKCSYTKYKEENRNYTGYGFIKPEDWFSKEEITELENYQYANPKAKKPGDLSGYTVDLKGFWVDNEMIIPDKITVNAMYAQTFDENGNLISSGGTHTDEIVYISGYENTENLPYFEYGTIISRNNDNPNNEKQNKLRQMVMDQSKLEEAVHQLYNSGFFAHRIDFLSYRYYTPVPYQNTIKVIDDQDLYSDFWTVIGRDINLWERAFPTLAFVWTSCLIIFSTAALVLARQTYKTYKQQEDLERQRKEMTNALAHDLKTPLSIISGYAQNLKENVHSEKRDHYASHIQSNVNRMDKIIHKMLELMRLEADSLQIKFEDVALDEVCEKIIDRYKLICQDKLITTSLEGKALIKADYALIVRVIDNFFFNAINNTPEGGSISIRIYDDTLEVYNSGSRIPEDKIDEIWLPFKKGDVSRNNTKGTGLGLAISRAILESHKFSYGAVNSKDGVIFWFRFR